MIEIQLIRKLDIEDLRRIADGYSSEGKAVIEKVYGAGLRVIVCETQNTNVTVIRVYQQLGFRIEGIDIS